MDDKQFKALDKRLAEISKHLKEQNSLLRSALKGSGRDPVPADMDPQTQHAIQEQAIMAAREKIGRSMGMGGY